VRKPNRNKAKAASRTLFYSSENGGRVFWFLSQGTMQKSKRNSVLN